MIGRYIESTIGRARCWYWHPPGAPSPPITAPTPVISEIYLLHHTHTDVGYTHPQPVFWELQRRIIDQAIDLCEQTADAPEASRVRWTCEVTWTVLHWLSRAPARQVERFRALARAGQLSVGALPVHLSPCANLPQFAHGLRALRLLREELAVPIRTAVSHDVNGQPWPLVDLLLDSGVEALFMGINIHSGGFPYQRPRWFHWQGPDGRRLPVHNGTHYNTFTRESQYPQGSTAVMQAALDDYLGRLERAGHSGDFVTLTSTNPFNSDNYPPDPLLARMVRRWNDEGRLPLIRFATPEMVLDRVLSQAAEVPVFTGDWSDYWNFGAASSATETRVNRNTARRLFAAGMLRTATDRGEHEPTLRSLDAWRNLVLFDEHTWGADRTVQSAQTDLIDESWTLNAAYAWRARSLTGLLLRDALDQLADNPVAALAPQSLLCFNPAPVRREVYVRVPAAWRDGSWRHCISNSARIEQDQTLWGDSNSALFGPVSLEPHSLAVLPIADLTLTPAAGMSCGPDFLETAFHRLGFDPRTGEVTSLIDKTQNREFIDPAAEWPFFGYVHEMPDPASHDLGRGELGRDAYYNTDWDRLHADEDCWRTDWKALRRGAGKLLDLRVEQAPDGIALVTTREAPGVLLTGGAAAGGAEDGFFGHLPRGLVQRIKLCALRPAVELSATFHKDDTRHAEAVYFAFPLELPDWSAHYDAAGVPTLWHDEQLDGSCKNWVSAGAWASIHNAAAGVTLAMPDTPLAQFGDFGFGRPQGFADRRNKPLLLGWALNNYWMTNFRASQAGPVRVRYELITHGAFDPVVATHAGLVAGYPVEVHPAMGAAPAARQFLRVSHPAVIPVQFSPCDDGSRSLLLILQNVTAGPVTSELELPAGGGTIYQSNPLGERLARVAEGSRFAVDLSPRGCLVLRIDPAEDGQSGEADPIRALWWAP